MPITNAIAWVACWYRHQDNDALSLTPEMIEAFGVLDRELGAKNRTDQSVEGQKELS